MFPSALLIWLWLALQPVSLQYLPPISEPLNAQMFLRAARTSQGDLEIGGELAGLAKGSVRFVRYEDLLRLPQESHIISDDTNFKGRTEISGVPLTSLAKLFGQASHSDLIVAICYHKYRSNYPSGYLVAHHPILVLKINGQLRDNWPHSKDGDPLGPYLISHPSFKPSYTILSSRDEPQIPFGVTRLDFRTESVVFGNIQPQGKWGKESSVWQGYQIARQDCFRCHGLYGEGGDRSSRSWLVLAARAAKDRSWFERYIRDPKSIQPNAKMPAHSEFDDVTLAALADYFRTFAPVREK